MQRRGETQAEERKLENKRLSLENKEPLNEAGMFTHLISTSVHAHCLLCLLGKKKLLYFECLGIIFEGHDLVIILNLNSEKKSNK